jgi:TPR repeat protein
MAAERGKVAEAQCRLGYLLAEGYGVKRYDHIKFIP